MKFRFKFLISVLQLVIPLNSTSIIFKTKVPSQCRGTEIYPINPYTGNVQIIEEKIKL